MTTTTEVGISPVLLQAITQTLSTNSSDRHSTSTQEGAAGGPQQVIVACDPDGPITTKLEAPQHILQGMNEPVTSYSSSQSGDTIVVVQDVDVETSEHQTEQSSGQQFIVKHIVTEQDSTDSQSDNSQIPVVISQGQELNMSNVLSAIASHLKNSRKQSTTVVSPMVVEDSVDVVCEPQVETEQHQPIYVSFPSSGAVPSPVIDITVSEVDNIATETVVQTISSSDGQHLMKRLRDIPNSTQGSPTTYVLNTDSLPQGSVYQTVETEQGTITFTELASADSAQDCEIGKPCPICGDKISGYHYGIFTCESCKGFFKRTVQNKKAFICHRKGDCMINLNSRKKCPACRFKRCLLHGMRLEAIREDRMRGGRSSYDGCSPHGRIKVETPSHPPRPVRLKSIPKRKIIHLCAPATSVVSDSSVEVVESEEHVIGPTESQPGDTVVPISDDSEVQQVEDTKLDVSMGTAPHTPQMLEDLLTVEALMADDDEEQDCCVGKLRDGDEDLFRSLLHLADHCLYRIVRWARNLPDFANVSTDDQIILLQSCWAELLGLCVCWNSMRGQSGYLLLSHGRQLDLEIAKAMGLAEVIQRLMDYTDHCRRLDMDTYEYTSLKVLMLMSPDVKGLKNEDVVREYQERVCESLFIHTITHYPHIPNKHCELLARLPELTRTCGLAKDQLNARQLAGEVPQFSLLSELLKGDIVVQPSE